MGETPIPRSRLIQFAAIAADRPAPPRASTGKPGASAGRLCEHRAMPSPLRLHRAFFTFSTVALAAALPLSCAVGASPFDIGNGGSIVVGNGGGATSSSGDMSSSTGSTSTSGFSSSTSSTTSSGFSSSTSSTTSSGFSSTSSSSTSSTSGASSVCDIGGPSNANCSNCSGCAQNGMCFNAVDDCENDFDCSIVLCCAANCSDNACVQECISFDPAGEGLFDALLQCLDCACVQTCSVPASVCP